MFALICEAATWRQVEAQANASVGGSVCTPCVSRPLPPSSSMWTGSLPSQLLGGRRPNLSNNCVIENVHRVPERMFQTGCERRQLLKWEELHDNLTSGTQTQLCFLIFHRHLYFTLSVGGVLLSQAALPSGNAGNSAHY